MSCDSNATVRGASEVLVVGAGLSGLSCARILDGYGVGVHVLEKSRGVGGRCATRRIDGGPVDHGLAFYHGDDPDFLAMLHSVASEVPTVWPRRTAGDGTPCQPSVLRTDQERLAFPSGVSVVPKALARGISIDFETRVTRIDTDDDRLTVVTESGKRYPARSVVLALPAGQSEELLRTVDSSASNEFASVIELLAGVSMVRCLTVIGGYAADIPCPEWDVCYPRDSDALQMVSQDSAKRADPSQPVFVFQARPRWSAEHWDDSADAWTHAVLSSARSVCGDWVTRPAWTDTQRWRFARLTGGDTLTQPLLVQLPNGSRIGIAGEAMAEGGGAQAAWLSGRRLAHRLVKEEE